MTSRVENTGLILMVDDNPGDVRLTLEALHESGTSAQLISVRDGQAAVQLLLNPPPGQRRPDLVLLDLNLPRMDGREVLAILRGDPRFRSLPVVVFSSSDAPHDIKDAYDRGANCYVVKPMELERFMTVVLQIERYWLGLAQLAGDTPNVR
jgi:CheY-like chemotaxis protein